MVTVGSLVRGCHQPPSVGLHCHSDPEAPRATGQVALGDGIASGYAMSVIDPDGSVRDVVRRSGARAVNSNGHRRRREGRRSRWIGS